MNRQADEVLKGKITDLKKLSSGDVQSLVYELEDARNRYSDLYDFSPLGYFTLTECLSD